MDEEKTAEIGSQSLVDKRLAEINLTTDSLQKVKTLVELMPELLPSRSTILQQALTSAQIVEDSFDKARALREVSLHLPEQQQQ